MKNFLIAFFFLFAIETYAQELNSIVSNHVFVMCDEFGNPNEIHEQCFFIVFHSNGTVNLLCGSTLNKAINNGAKSSGTWSSSGGSVSWRWKDTGKGASASRSGYSEDLISGDGGIFKNLGSF
jgi:hypothetical protein